MKDKVSHAQTLRIPLVRFGTSWSPDANSELVQDQHNPPLLVCIGLWKQQIVKTLLSIFSEA